ncbi:MAG: PAS domain S-box protein, partial [Gemmatimonadales bacterium]
MAAWVLFCVPPLLAQAPQEAPEAASDAATLPATDTTTLVVSQDHSWPPFAFRDDDGEPRGILVDLWHEIGRQLDRPVEFLLADWNESIEQVVRGEAMVHGGLFESPERRERLAFGGPLLPLSAVLYIRSSALVLEVDELAGRTVVGVVGGSFELEHLRATHPDLETREFATNADMVQAAAEGEIDAFAVDYPVGLYLLDRYSEPGEFHVLTRLYSQELSWAVAPGQEALIPLVDGALAAIPPGERTRITQRWITTEQVETVPAWFWPSVVALLFSTLFVLAASYALLLRVRRRRLEEEVAQRTASLREQRARLENIIEGGGLGTWEAALADGELRVNARWAEMLGRSHSEVDPLPYNGWAELVHPDDLPVAEEAIRRHMAGETELYQAEFRMRHKNGDWIWIHSSGRLMPAVEGGPPTRMFGCHVSLHERRTLELQVERQQRMEGIGALAGGVAHDLNNILTPILLSLDRLRDPELPVEERLALVEGMEEGARRGADIVGQVLSYARGEKGSTALVDVGPVLMDLRRMLGETLPRSLELEVEVEEDLPPVAADPTHLRQILLNLAVNARDALAGLGVEEGTEAQGTADRAWETAGPGRIRMEAQRDPDGTVVVLRVSDTGPGMSRHTQSRIFDPFFTTKPHGKGTGLGLSTTLTLVESNGGSIDVESAPGQGTTFTLTFPAAGAEAIRAMAAPRPPGLPTPPPGTPPPGTPPPDA